MNCYDITYKLNRMVQLKYCGTECAVMDERPGFNKGVLSPIFSSY